MQWKWVRWAAVCVFGLLFVAIIIPFSSQAVTLWAYKSIGGMPEKVPSVDIIAQQIQNMLNLIDFVAVVFTAIIAVAGLIGVRSFRDFEQETKKQLDALDAKRASIDELQQSMQGKIDSIGDLQSLVELQRSVTQGLEDTNKALLYLVLGNQLVEQKKIADAIEAYERVKVLRPTDSLVNYILGRTYRGITSYDQAITCLETSVEADSSFAPAHYELALAYRQRADKLYKGPQNEFRHEEEYDKAIEQMKLAIKLQPWSEDALGSLGGIYRRAKDYKHALIYYKRALEVNGSSSYAAGNVAVLSWHEGDIPVAKETFKRTEEIASKRIEVGSYEPYWDYYDRGMAQLILGNKAVAFTDYHKAIELTRSPEHFRTVLDSSLLFLKEVEDKYPIDGLDEVVEMMKMATTEAEERVVAKHVM